MVTASVGVLTARPNAYRQIVLQLFAAGKSSAALKIHQRYYPLFKDLFLETNPVPIKAALAMAGQIQEEYRLPLVPMSARNRESLNRTLEACGVLKKSRGPAVVA